MRISTQEGISLNHSWMTFTYYREGGVTCVLSINKSIDYIGLEALESGDGPIDQSTPEHILTFLNRLTEGNKPYTKRIRYSQISSFFNFVHSNIDPELRNPCYGSKTRKLYRDRVPLRWKIIEKDAWGRSFPAPPFTAPASTAAASCSIPSAFTTTSP